LFPFFPCGIINKELCDLPLHRSFLAVATGGGFYFPGYTGALYPQIGNTSIMFRFCARRRLIRSSSVTRRPIRLAVIGQ